MSVSRACSIVPSPFMNDFSESCLKGKPRHPYFNIQIRGLNSTTEPGENDLPYCQRTTASGDCRLRPAGAERSSFGNAISGWTVRLYVSKRNKRTELRTSILGRWTSTENKKVPIF